MSDKNENIENALDALYSKKMEKTVDNEVVDSSFDDNNNGNINTMKNLEDKIDAVKDVEVDDSPNEDLFPKDLQNHELEKRYIWRKICTKRGKRRFYIFKRIKRTI